MGEAVEGAIEDKELLCSVVVPVHNEGAPVLHCLDALRRQTISPHQFEVLVVDAASADGSAQQVADWLASAAIAGWRLVRSDEANLAVARNLGAQQARGPLLLFTNADCVPAPQWVAALTAVFADGQVAGAKGAVATEQPGLTPRFVQAEYAARYAHVAAGESIDFIDNYAAAYRRDIFWANDGFDPQLQTGENPELSFRLADKGYRMVFVPAAVVHHRHDLTMTAYLRRKYATGFWKVPLTRLHPERMVHDTHTPQVLKLQIVLASLLVGLPPVALLGLWWPLLDWVWLAWAVCGGLFLLSAGPFLGALRKNSWRLALFGVPMLFGRALALGVGYLAGTIHFAGALPGARQPIIPGWKRVIKRTIDVVGALVGLALAIPLVAVAALAIKLDSPGPVFYWQVRVGENGRRFRIVKLRSMVTDADKQLDQLVDLERLSVEPAFKIANDPRITRVGRLLRRTSVDELPQFLNVLKGEMSLVGPRPEEERVVAFYSDHHRKRLAVKPGLTGPMQVSGRGSLSFSERLELELDYIEHYSLQRDLEILLRTVPVVCHGKGAH